MIAKTKFFGLPARTSAPGFAVRTSKPSSAPARSMAGFDSASQSRLFGDWITGNITNNSILRTQLLPLRHRCRDLARNDDYYKGFIKLLRRNVVGPRGLRVKFNALNGDGRPDKIANGALDEAYAEFSKPANFTTSGQWDRATFEKLTLETVCTDGEALIRRVKGFNGNPFGYAVQPIAVDHIDENKNETLANGNVVTMGVEKDPWGKTVAYHIRTVNPGELSIGLQAGQRTERKDAKEFIHLFLPQWFDQVRGIPWAHSAAKRLHMLDGYEEGALEASRGAACKNTYFKQMPDADGRYVGDGKDVAGDWLENMEPGLKALLPPGIEPYQIDPAFPQTQHGEFVKAVLRGVAVSLGSSYISIASDLEGVNFSSSRTGILEEREEWKALQVWFALLFEFMIVSDFVELALMNGAIKLPSGVVLPYTTDRAKKFNRPLFRGRRWAWIDPLKDANANKMNLEMGLTSRTRLADELDSDFPDIVEELSLEAELLDSANVRLPGAEPAPAMNPDEEDDDGNPKKVDENGDPIEDDDGNPTAPADPKKPAKPSTPADPKKPTPPTPPAQPENKATQIFGYHLENAVVKINEARERLGLPPVDKGELTVPEFLALLNQPSKTPKTPKTPKEPAETPPAETPPAEPPAE